MQGRHWISTGAVLCGLAVATGAFAAHFLEGRFGESFAGSTREVAGETIPAARYYLDVFNTAAEYQMTHGLALLAVGLLAMGRPSRSLQIAGWCFLTGTLIFSGSLYLLTLTGIRWLGAITPIGGTALIAGWAAFAVAALSTVAPER